MFTLSPEQQAAFDKIENSDKCQLVVGKPGVGKSVLIRHLMSVGQKHYSLAAPTGLAALNIGGKTLHSLLGIKPSEGIFQSDYNNFSSNDNVTRFIEHGLKHLIIDEISMVRADMLDYIDRLLKTVKQSELPFGGVQVIAFGDFFQLPPVAKSDDLRDLLKEGYQSEFAFKARAFKGFEVTVLEQVHRQSDPIFLKLLNNIRNGKVTGKDIAMINKRVEQPTDIRVKLTPLNRQADQINQNELRAIKSPAETYKAVKYGYWPATPVDFLTLKVGAQVMIKKNGADRPPGHKGPFESSVVNGTLGKVLRLPTKEDPTVKVEVDGREVTIYKNRWERLEKQKNEDGRWEEKPVASFEQYPLQLAWAISIHKCQGQTFEKVHIDPQSIFAAGQFYVALSRAKSLEGVTLERGVSQRTFMVDKRVLSFMNNL